MFLTAKQIDELRKIVRDASAAVAIGTAGMEVAPEELARLVDEGYIQLEELENLVMDSFEFGRIMAELPVAAQMTYPQLKTHLAHNPVELTERELLAYDQAVERAGQFCVGLGTRYSGEVGERVIKLSDELAAEFREGIETAAGRAIASRAGVGRLTTRLRQMSEDWARDWGRIASTESQFAHEHGKLVATMERHGREVMMAKVPEPSACDDCKRLYLGPDGLPIVMPASWWEGNGVSNVGLKRADWRPVLGAVHPWCRCRLVRVPAGMTFDEGWDLVPIEDEADDAIARTPVQVELEEPEAEQIVAKSRKLHGRRNWNGLELSIENRKGSTRHWYDVAAKREGTTTMKWPYGYIRRTEAADGEHVDCYVGPDDAAKFVYVVHQLAAPEFKSYDEDKVMLGFPSRAEAKRAYLDHFDHEKGFGGMTAIISAEFVDRVKAGEYRDGAKIEKAEQIGFDFSAPAKAKPQPRLKVSRGGPFIGPRGGKWADPQHTIHWEPQTLSDGYRGTALKPGMALEAAEDAIRGLKVEHAAVFMAGRLIHRVKGKKHTVPVTAELASKIKRDGGAVFTHNHPSGSPFSPDDLALAINCDIAEIRAVLPNGGHWSLKRPGPTWDVPFEDIPNIRTVARALNHVGSRAHYAACDTIDSEIRAAGGTPGDPTSPAFSFDRWIEILNESYLEQYNRFLAPSGARIFHHGPEVREGSADKPTTDPRRYAARISPYGPRLIISKAAGEYGIDGLAISGRAPNRPPVGTMGNWGGPARTPGENVTAPQLQDDHPASAKKRKRKGRKKRDKENKEKKDAIGRNADTRYHGAPRPILDLTQHGRKDRDAERNMAWISDFQDQRAERRKHR